MKVKYFFLDLEALSPLVVRSDHAPGGAGNAEYIPGTALAGSLAAVHRLYYPTDTTAFEQLFLSGQVQYPDLYPATFKSAVTVGGERAQQDGRMLPVYPLPKTAQSCKRFPGFLHDRGEDPDPPHGVYDSLLDWTVFQLGKRTSGTDEPIDTRRVLAPLQKYKKCRECEKPLEHFTGFYRSDGQGRMRRAEVDRHKRLQTHTGINRETATVQENILYNRRVFEEHMRFWGKLKVSEDLADAFEAFIAQVGQSGLVRIGTGRTRGLGKVRLSVGTLNSEQDEQKRFDRLKTRLHSFDARLHLHAGEAFGKDFQSRLTSFYFALTLHSPAIVRDHLLRYRGSIDQHTLAALLEIPADSANPFQLLYQAASTRRVTGWNELWGTPRTNEYAIDTGSVFLFASTLQPDEALALALFKLEEMGIGQRTAEGFGRVSVSDQFHLEVSLK